LGYSPFAGPQKERRRPQISRHDLSAASISFSLIERSREYSVQRTQPDASVTMLYCFWQFARQAQIEQYFFSVPMFYYTSVSSYFTLRSAF
jgi:hypothetical protein